MKCIDIEEILPGYLDGALTEEEQGRVEEHLARCPGCRECLDDLKKAVALVGDMEKAEPPAGFTRDIMARVRKEADLKREPGFLRKLFFPLHVKIPIQAFATVCIVVLAFYLFRSVGPEVRMLEHQPARVQDSAQVQENTSPVGESAPAAVQPEAEKPALEKAARPLKMQGGGESAARFKGMDAASGRVQGRASHVSAPPAKEYAPAENESAAAENMAAPRGQGQAPSFPAAPSQEYKKAAPPDVGVSPESRDMAMPALEDKAEKARAARPMTKALPAPAQSVIPEGRAVMKQEALPSPLTVTLGVPDLDSGVRAVEKILADLPARIVWREMLPGRSVIVAEIRGSMIREYLNRIGAIGKVEGKVEAGSVPEGFVQVRTELKPKPR